MGPSGSMDPCPNLAEDLRPGTAGPVRLGHGRARPKVLLHDHLDGGLRPRRSSTSPARPGTSCRRDEPEQLGHWFVEACDSGSLERYLETFDHTVAVMQRAGDLRRVARECVEDLAADGVVYAEVRYAPEQHLQDGLTLQEVVDAVREGFEEGQAAAASRAPHRGPPAAHGDAPPGTVARDRRAGGRQP